MMTPVNFPLLATSLVIVFLIGISCWFAWCK